MKNHDNKNNQRVVSLSQTRKTNNKGLTLVELLGVVAIVAIVAALALLSVAGTFKAAQEAAVKKQEMELNRAYTSYLASGGTWTDLREVALAQLSEPLIISGGITAGPWIRGPFGGPGQEIPRVMKVGQEERQLALYWSQGEGGEFASNAWIFRYLTQTEIEAQTPSTPTPTPTPVPTPTLGNFTITVLGVENLGGTGAYTRPVGTYSAVEGSSFSVGVIPEAGSRVQSWKFNGLTPASITGETSNSLSFVVEGDTSVYVALEVDPTYVAPPEATPVPTPTPPPATPEPTPSTYKVTVLSSNHWNVWAGSEGENEVQAGETFEMSMGADYGSNFRITGVNGAPAGANFTDQTGTGWGWNSTLSFVVTSDVTLSVAWAEMGGVNYSSVKLGGQYQEWGMIQITPAGLATSSLNNPNFKGGLMFPLGTQITLRATPLPGYVFVGWRGAVFSATNPATFTVSQSSVVINAEFAPAP